MSSFQYTFAKEPFKMGNYDDQYGQAYWCEVNEHLQPVKFNIMSRRTLTIDDAIECEERTEKQTKGDPEKNKKPKPYYQLKKVKVTEASPEEPLLIVDPKEPLPEHDGYKQEYPSTPEQANAVSKANNPQLDRIEKQLSQIQEAVNKLMYGEEQE